MNAEVKNLVDEVQQHPRLHTIDIHQNVPRYLLAIL
jgi:hypothetical protein